MRAARPAWAGARFGAPIGRWIGWLSARLTGRLTGWPTCLLTVLMAGLLAGILFGRLGVSPARAEADGSVVVVELLVPPLQALTVEPVVLETPTPTAEDLRTGFLDLPGAVTARIQSNQPWCLAARRADAFCAPVECVRPEREPLPIEEAWTVVAAGAPTEERIVEFSLRIPLTWESAVPGLHELRLDYRLWPAGSIDLAETHAGGVR